MAKNQSTVTDISAQPATNTAEEQRGAAPDDADEVNGTNHDTQLDGKRVTLTIHASQEEGGANAVNVGLNGFMYQIPRNTPCRVPMEVAEIIKTAVNTIFRPGANGIPVASEMPRYAYSITP